MNLKKLGSALLVAILIGVVGANNAYAVNEYSETGGAWYTGASPGTKLVGGRGITTAARTMGVKQTLETTVGGTPLRISVTGIECQACTIENFGTSAKLTGTLEFTGLSVIEPFGCSLPASWITTKPLTAVLGMNTAKTLATLKFTPSIGATFAITELVGGSCAIAGSYKMTGTLFWQAANATGVFWTEQAFSASRFLQESAGTSNSLKFGENAAYLAGTIMARVGGTEWAGKES